MAQRALSINLTVSLAVSWTNRLLAVGKTSRPTRRRSRSHDDHRLDAAALEIPVLLITGPVGVGKTSVASEVSERLDQAGIAHALVDVDSLRWCCPRPPGDRFRIELAMRNLAAIWPNLLAAGARRLVLVDVVESREDDVRRIGSAVPGADVGIVRLRARTEVLIARVEQREPGLGRGGMLRRAAELATQMDDNPVEDFLIETDGRTIPEIAEEVLARSGWLAAPPA